MSQRASDKRFYWHNPSHSAWPSRWTANNFEKSESPPQTCGTYQWGCQLTSDQALGLLCSKGHVRVRGRSTLRLWRHQITRWGILRDHYHSVFLTGACTDTVMTSLFRGSSATKKLQENPEISSPTRYRCHVYKISLLAQKLWVLINNVKWLSHQFMAKHFWEVIFFQRWLLTLLALEAKLLLTLKAELTAMGVDFKQKYGGTNILTDFK